MTTEQDPLQPVPPPAGLTRRQRSLWEQDDEARRARYAAENGLPAPALSRGGRKAYREETKTLTRSRIARERDEQEAARSRGLLIVLIVVALIGAGVWLWPDSDPPTPTRSAPTSSPPAPTTVAPVGGGSATGDAVATAEAWYALTCPATPDVWPDSARQLMTEEAWANDRAVPPPVVHATWMCSDVHATPLSGRRDDGTVLVQLTATRTISTGTTPTSTEQATDVRVMHQQPNGWWLIDLGHEH